MGIALVATGYWMHLDVPATPNAVVACVIIFNAAFGYRFVVFSSELLGTYVHIVGVHYLGCTRLR